MSSEARRVVIENSMQSDGIEVITAGVKDRGESVTGVAVCSDDCDLYLTVDEARRLAYELLHVAAKAEADNEQ